MLDQLSDPVERDEVLGLVANGIAAGAFTHHSPIIQEAIESYGKGLLPDLQARKARSSYSRVYLFSSASVAGLSGLVVRVVPATKQDLLLRAWTEATLFQEIRRDDPRFRTPQHLGSYEEDGEIVFLSELLPGEPVSRGVVGRAEAARIAEAIRYTQQSISLTAMGARLLDLPDRYNPFCRTKVARLFRKFCKVEIASAKLSVLDELDAVRKKTRVAVSDRTPVNFLLDAQSVGIVDLDLVLAGTPFEDWAWFINDDRLRTSLTRRELVEVFCVDYQQFVDTPTEELFRNFSLASIFVAFKQAAMAQSTGDAARKRYLLDRVKESALELGALDAVEVAEELGAVRL